MRGAWLPRLLAVSLGLAACSAAPSGPQLPGPAQARPRPGPRAVAAAPVAGRRDPSVPAVPPAHTAASGTGDSLPWLKGQTHVHTSGSYDARTPADQVLRFYAERRYDFVAITDHNRISAAAAPAGLLVIPAVELTQNSATCSPLPPAGYRCLLHTTGLFVDPARDPHHGQRFRPAFVPERLAAYQAQLRQIADLGGIGVVNHPHFHFAADARMLAALGRSGLRLFELVNAALDAQHPAGRDDAQARAERLWDQVLGAGTVLWAIASDDAHHFSDAEERRRQGKSAYLGDRAWVMVRAERSPEAIRAALLAGRFYASTGVRLRELQASPQRLRLEIELAAGERAETRFIGRGGRELGRVDGPRAEYLPRGDEGYVRAVVRDGAGRQAWVQPVVVSP